MIYSHHKKIDQDKIILQFMDISTPKRRTVDDTSSVNNRQISVKYFIKTEKGKIPVCAKTFQKITGNLAYQMKK